MEHANQSGTLAKSDLLGPSEYDAPDNSWESRAIRQATVVMTMDRKDVQRMVRPALPQIGPRRVAHGPVFDVEDAFNAGTDFPDQRAYFSGGPAGYSGASRYTSGSDFG